MLAENTDRKDPDEGLWFSNFIPLKSCQTQKQESICDTGPGMTPSAIQGTLVRLVPRDTDL